jgi:hypothetical protein
VTPGALNTIKRIASQSRLLRPNTTRLLVAGAMPRGSLGSSGLPLPRSIPLSLDTDFQPIVDTEGDQRSGYQPRDEPPKEPEPVDRHTLRTGLRSPHMSVRSLVGFSMVSVLLLVIFVLMSDWRSMFG